MKQLNLEILTPYGKYYAGQVDWIQVRSEDFLMEILPNHAPLVSSLVVSKMIIKNHNEETMYAIGGGLVSVAAVSCLTVLGVDGLLLIIG